MSKRSYLMSTVIDHSERQRNIIERILIWIPGFRGYLKKEYRRESDKLEREFLAGKLEQNRTLLRNLMEEASHQGSLKNIDLLDRIEKRLDRLICRIRFADYGYSGFFDVVKVRDRELEQLYQFDLDLLQAVEALAVGFGALKSAAGDAEKFATRARSLAEEVQKLDEKFSQREQIIIGKYKPDRPRA
jgi:vacuolar-type H+-ATPase subunit I/STV1